MAVPARMKAFVTQVAVTQKEGARKALIATARAEEARVLREQTARAGGIAPSLTRIVDGRRGAAYESVGDNGVIILQWRYLREIAAVTLRRLRERAPEQSGDYKRGLMLFVGDAEAAPDAAIPAGAQRLTVVATVPYARRLEIGKDAAGGPFVVQVAPHIVAETATLLGRDYAGVAQIRFTYEDVAGPAAGRGRARGESRALRYPAIRVVDPR